MMKRHRRWVVVVACLFVAAACTSDDPAPASRDAGHEGEARDGSAHDGGTRAAGGARADGGARMDAGREIADAAERDAAPPRACDAEPGTLEICNDGVDND